MGFVKIDLTKPLHEMTDEEVEIAHRLMLSEREHRRNQKAESTRLREMRPQWEREIKAIRAQLERDDV